MNVTKTELATFGFNLDTILLAHTNCMVHSTDILNVSKKAKNRETQTSKMSCKQHHVGEDPVLDATFSSHFQS